MRNILSFALVAIFLVACGGGSGSNPIGSIGSLNPFGGRDVVRDSEGVPRRVAVDDGSILVPSLTSVVPEPALRGLIIKATATAPSQGYHSATLVAQNRGAPDEDGVVTFEFRVIAPRFTGDIGPARTRQLIAAAFITDGDLNNISSFRVISDSNIVNLRR